MHRTPFGAASRKRRNPFASPRTLEDIPGFNIPPIPGASTRAAPRIWAPMSVRAPRSWRRPAVRRSRAGDPGSIPRTQTQGGWCYDACWRPRIPTAD
jgi:hypothetical protein